MNSEQSFSPTDFVDSFRAAWHEYRVQEGDEKIAAAFSGTSSWTRVLLGTNEGPPFTSSTAVFTRTAHHLDRMKPGLIKQIRHEDDKIDLLMVGGVECFKNRGWGYASRHLVLVEHENNVDRVEDEFYKAIFHSAELRVVAFPNYSAKYIEDRMGGEDPAQSALGKLLDLASKCGSHRLDNLLVLVAQAPESGGMPEWRYLAMTKEDCSLPFEGGARLQIL